MTDTDRLVHCCGCDLSACEGIVDHAPDVAAMAKAGQALAVRWGHQPWSDSWAVLVAETMLKGGL